MAVAVHQPSRLRIHDERAEGQARQTARTVGRIVRLGRVYDARLGDSYDNALAETIIGLFKTEVIRQQGPWRGIDAVELATLEWVDWFNHRRLLEPIGNMPPAEKEDEYYRQRESAMVA